MKKPLEVLQSLLRHADEHLIARKMRSHLRSAGVQVVYAALLLYQAYRKPTTPPWAKRMVLGAIAYALAPIDAIPDLSPIIGFTDDLGVLMFGLVSIAGHIDHEVKESARQQLCRWCGEVNQADLDALERKIG